MADMNINAPAGQATAMAPPVRTDDQILPRIRLVPIGKSNCYLDLEKSQSNPIYKIAVDLLKHTNFFKAFTASSTIPSIYIQQLWDTVQYDKTVGCYRCQLDEQWFVLTKDTLREALQITPVNDHQAFVTPPSSDALINFVNKLGYPKLRRHRFYPRPDSLLHLPNEEPVLGYLKFSAKVARSAQQNGVVERRNHTLTKTARTIVVNQTPEAIAPIAEVIPPGYVDSTGSPSSTTVEQDAPSTSYSPTPSEIQSSVIPQDVGDDNLDMEVVHMGNDTLFGVPI
nr:hypothetical protein [Tanacetum cinerariifolium]